MIRGFSSRLAEDIYHGVDSRYARKLTNELHAKAHRLLDQLDSVTRVESLRVPPSNHLEKLSGNLAGYWSIRINKQWRVIFCWENEQAYNVDIIDYH